MPGVLLLRFVFVPVRDLLQGLPQFIKSEHSRIGYEQAQGETVEAMEKVREMMREEREREEEAARELAEKRKEP